MCPPCTDRDQDPQALPCVWNGWQKLACWRKVFIHHFEHKTSWTRSSLSCTCLWPEFNTSDSTESLCYSLDCKSPQLSKKIVCVWGLVDVSLHDQHRGFLIVTQETIQSEGLGKNNAKVLLQEKGKRPQKEKKKKPNSHHLQNETKKNEWGSTWIGSVDLLICNQLLYHGATCMHPSTLNLRGKDYLLTACEHQMDTCSFSAGFIIWSSLLSFNKQRKQERISKHLHPLTKRWTKLSAAARCWSSVTVA